MTISLLVVDDHPIVRGGIIALLSAEHDSASIIVLTTYDTDDAIVRAIKAGAAGYLLKDAPPDDLVDAVRRVAAGETVLAPLVAKRLVDRVRDPDAGALSAREIEVLEPIVINRPEDCSVDAPSSFNGIWRGLLIGTQFSNDVPCARRP